MIGRVTIRKSTRCTSGPEGVKSAETEEVAPGIMLDFDESGDVIGAEILYVSRRSAKSGEAA